MADEEDTPPVILSEAEFAKAAEDYLQIRTEIKEHREKVKELNEELTDFQRSLLYTMVKQETKSVTINGVKFTTKITKKKVKPAKEDIFQRAYELFRSGQLNGLSVEAQNDMFYAQVYAPVDIIASHALVVSNPRKRKEMAS